MLEQTLRTITRRARRTALPLLCLHGLTQFAAAQSVLTFAGNAQHTAIYQPAARNLNRILWSTPIDLNNTGAFAHYGAPLISASNTVAVPVKTAANGFQINVFNGIDGTAKYSLSTDYILPSYTWIPVYQPVLATIPTGLRLYFPGAGGTVYFIDNPDSISHGVQTRVAFYGLSNYQANISGFNSTVFINTPITADSNGNIFFGFRVQGTAPAPLATTQSGFARIDPNGNATYVLASTAAADAAIKFDSHNSAPALSSDGSTLYVVVKSGSTEYYGYLLGLDAVTLATKYKVFLKDPRDGNANNAGILDVSTASPTVAPDGDVYFGIFSNPDNGSRGFLLRFSADLTVEKTPGGFGWDYTPAIVPASMAPLYTGSSSYLIFSKYNNYANAGDGNGVNRIALIDPNATQIDPHPSANGLVEMREVLTVIGTTPDDENPSLPNAVREWCINTAAVNPATNSIFTPSEDGHIYRWNLATNSLSQALALSPGIGEPYVPSVIGPDGTVYTLNGGTMFALGDLPVERVTLSSSIPDVRTAVTGQALTFTAAVANTSGSGLVPTGSVTIQDTVYFVSGSSTGSTTNVIATVPLDGSGNAAVSTSSLSATNHFITAVYGGDGNFSPGSATLVQKVHGYASATSLTSSPNPSTPGQAVTFTATVAPVPPGSTIPTGMVTFQEGAAILAQVSLGAAGTASFSTSSLNSGSHTMTAVYASDSLYAASSGGGTQVVQNGGATTTSVSSTPNPSAFGQVVTFTAVLTSGAGVPAGTVTFLEGANVLASGVNVVATGRASFVTSALAVGTHVITANFTGTGGWANSSGNDSGSPQVIGKAGTTAQLSSSSATTVFSQPVTFTATVTVNSPGSGVPSGTVTFKDGAVVLGSGSLDATGRATLTISVLAVGSHSITATYTGGTNFNGSSSTALSQTVNPDPTTTALTSSADPASAGQAVTFTATVTANAPVTGTPTGTVTIRDKGKTVATVALDATGHAAFTTSALAQGAHQMTATYDGTAGFAGSVSPTLVENIKK